MRGGLRRVACVGGVGWMRAYIKATFFRKGRTTRTTLKKVKKKSHKVTKKSLKSKSHIKVKKKSRTKRAKKVAKKSKSLVHYFRSNLSLVFRII